MEKSILLLQTEISILQFEMRSLNETAQAMKGRISYDLNTSMNRAIMSLEKEVITKQAEIESLRVIWFWSMKGIIISSNHTVIIDGFQIDMWYNFERSRLEIYVDGQLETQGNFTPSFKTFNYINLMDVAATTLEKHKKKKIAQDKESDSYITSSQRNQ